MVLAVALVAPVMPPSAMCTTLVVGGNMDPNPPTPSRALLPTLPPVVVDGDEAECGDRMGWRSVRWMPVNERMLHMGGEVVTAEGDAAFQRRETPLLPRLVVP